MLIQDFFQQENYKDSLALLSSLNLSLLPVLFFFNFLYYTDTVSTTMVLLMYSLYLSGAIFYIIKDLTRVENLRILHD